MSVPRELLDRVYDTWNRRDFEGGIVLFHPDLELHSSGDFPGLAETYHGREGMRTFWHEFNELWESIQIEVCRYEQAGDRTVVLWRFDGVGRGGVPVKRDGAHLMGIEDGMVRYMRSFGSWERAREEAGLNEA